MKGSQHLSGDQESPVTRELYQVLPGVARGGPENSEDGLIDGAVVGADHLNEGGFPGLDRSKVKEVPAGCPDDFPRDFEGPFAGNSNDGKRGAAGRGGNGCNDIAEHALPAQGGQREGFPFFAAPFSLIPFFGGTGGGGAPIPRLRRSFTSSHCWGRLARFITA